MGNNGGLQALAHDYTFGRWRRGEIGDATRDATIYTLATLADVMGNRPITSLGPKIIDRWMESIADRAPSTRRNYLSRVRHFCGWLIAERHIRRDPTAHVPAIRQPRRVVVTFSDDQLEHLGGQVTDQRARCVLAIMAGVGARCVEVSRLRVEDYDAHGRTLLLRGKGDHERVVPVPGIVAAEIDAYLDEVGVVGGPLIRSRTEPMAGLAAATLSHYVRGWLLDAGVKVRALDGRSAHGLRRTCGSDAMDRCGDIQVVQAILGHQRIETTARHYLRAVSVEQMRAAMERDIA